jgi:hypothetical protein
MRIEQPEHHMKDNKAKPQKSPRGRFIFGAALGIAISIPIFAGIESPPLKAFFMLAFAGLMGAGQVIGGRDTPGARKFTRYAMIGAFVAMFVGIIAFMIID